VFGGNWHAPHAKIRASFSCIAVEFFLAIARDHIDSA